MGRKLAPVRWLGLLLLWLAAACRSSAPWPGDFVGNVKSQLGEEGNAQQASSRGYLKVREREDGKPGFTLRGQFAVPGLASIELATCDWKASPDGDRLTVESATCNAIDTADCHFRMGFLLGRVAHSERELSFAALGTLTVRCEGKDPAFASGDRALRVAFDGLRQ